MVKKMLDVFILILNWLKLRWFKILMWCMVDLINVVGVGLLYFIWIFFFKELLFILIWIGIL